MALQRLSNAWIFVSHATPDLLQVRRVRDKLEALGASPLLFHLKCLQDDGEVFSLLEREIAARRFFLLCESDAARVSPWVQREREVVCGVGRKIIQHIDVAADVEGHDLALRSFVERANVFVSNAHRDRQLVDPYIQDLIRQDLAVFYAEQSLTPGADWRAEIEDALRRACTFGVFVSFLSTNALASRFVTYELEAALELASKCVFVALEPLSILQRQLSSGVSRHHIIEAAGSRPLLPQQLTDEVMRLVCAP